MAFMWCGAYSSLISGVKKWSKKSEDALKRQEAISVEAWVKAMDSRIISLGGEGVQRFLGNLFRAFDGLFESSSLPSKYAGKAITVMQRVRQIKAVSGVSFFKKEKSLTSIDLHWPIQAKSTKAERVHTYIRDVKDKHVARDQSRGNQTSRVTFLYFYPRSPPPPPSPLNVHRDIFLKQILSLTTCCMRIDCVFEFVCMKKSQNYL